MPQFLPVAQLALGNLDITSSSSTSLAVCDVGRFFAANCILFRSPFSRTSSPSGADARSHPRCWATCNLVVDLGLHELAVVARGIVKETVKTTATTRRLTQVRPWFLRVACPVEPKWEAVAV